MAVSTQRIAKGGRRYRILGLLGEGGFGRVYKARLEDDQGFTKDVAIKLGDSNAPEDMLKRFRDEARILGLVRDRAIVNVEPPTRLGARWAVVMEFVEGASLSQLLAARTKLPNRVALGVVQEVARALDSIYSAPGPDGRPLELIHRDLKPGNLQVTRSGEVKILDFGLARATFVGREADSTSNIGGTLGYIAPERLEGREGPASDIYSLGVVLRTLITGIGPRQWNKFEEESSTVKDPKELLVRALAEDMMSTDPDERPTARQVEERCVQLSGQLRGPTLRAWCLEYVRPPGPATRDVLIGSVLSETLASLPTRIDDSQNLVRNRRRPPWVLAAVGSLGTGVVVGLGAVLVLAVGLAMWSMSGTLPSRDELDLDEVMSDLDPDPIDLGPDPVIEDEPPDEELEPAPVARTEHVVGFESEPPGAQVYIDGVLLGTAPLDGELVLEGKHELRMVFGFDVIEAAIEVGERRPAKYLWEVGEPLQVSY